MANDKRYLGDGLYANWDGRRVILTAENGIRATDTIYPRNGHPCPKPIGQWRWLLNRTSLPGETVIDPFCGSGTTLLAAKELGRKAIGVELEEKYAEIAAKRLSQKVFDFEPKKPLDVQKDLPL